MQAVLDASDGDLARAIGASPPGAASEAEAELYRRFAPRVRLYGLRHLRDDEAARDLAQHVLLMTIQKLREGAVRAADEIGSFILGTSRTVVIDVKRREQRRSALRDTFLSRDASVLPQGDAHLDLDRLDSCLSQLPDRERAVVLMTFYGDRQATDVAQELGLTGGNVRVIRHRALTRLRACLGHAMEAV